MSIFIFIRNISAGKPITIFGDGSQKRDFTFVDDIACGVLQLLQPCGYEIFNLGNNTVVGLMDVIHLIENGLGKKAVIEYQPSHPADVHATWAVIGKAEVKLNWKPTISIDEGVAKTLAWFKENESFLQTLKW